MFLIGVKDEQLIFGSITCGYWFGHD